MALRKQKEKSRIFAEKAKGGFSGSFSQLLGYCWILISACMIIGLSLRALFRQESVFDERFYYLIAGCVFALFLILWGRNRKSFVRRYRYYRNFLEGREMISFEELSFLTGKKTGYLKKDMKRLIQQRTLLQGHLDEEETCLFLTKEAYAQYIRLGRVKKETERESQENGTDFEDKTLKETGEEYLMVLETFTKRIESKEVQKCIAEIGGYAVQILNYEGISDQVERFLSYYFPTTEKLLSSYEELEKEEVAPEGEDVLDMLYTVRYSFQTFCEKLSEGKRMDVETDILALEMMLQELQ